jgi:hypothetical protein
MIKKERLHSILETYASRGMIKGRDLLLNPSDALEMAEKLGEVGVPIMGISGWYYVDRSKGYIAEDLEADFSVGDEIWFSPNRLERSVAKVKSYIQNSLPPTTELVSLDVDLPEVWSFLDKLRGS